MSRSKRLIVLAMICLVPAAPRISAQEVRASLGGRVTDAHAGVVPNAKVTVTSDDTGVSQYTTANEQGNWVVKYLLPGHYQFSVAADGFRALDRKGITLQTADVKTIDVELEVGSVTTSIEVLADAPLIDTTTATSGSVINATAMNELPSVNRVPTLYATLSPGVVQVDQNNNSLHGWSYNGASQMTLGGGRNTIYSNFYAMDGFPNVKSGGNIAFIPSPDTLSEFRVEMDAYDASVGRQAGGTINMTSKSGGKDYHGSLYEFNQNTFLNAKQSGTSATSPIPPVHLNIWGGTFGGPVRIPKLYDGRKRTFFFVSYEGLRNSNPNGGTSSVPTSLERQGDFSQSWTSQLAGGQRVRYNYTIYDPATVDSKTGNRTPFPNNLIPTTRLDPIALKLLTYVPLPNNPGDGTSNTSGNYIEPSVRQDKMEYISTRVDQQWTNQHRSFVVVRWDSNHESQGNKFLNVSTGTDQVRTPKTVGLDHVWLLSPSSILDLRFSVNRYEEQTGNLGVGYDPGQLGFPSSSSRQWLYPQFPQIVGVASNFGADTNTYNENTFYTWAASLTHVLGNHSLRYGGEYWILPVANGSYGPQPQFDFSTTIWTRQNNTRAAGTGEGNAMSQFLLGLPSGGTINNPSTQLWTQRFGGLYVQDDWRVTPRLTVNFGLRWDVELPTVERYNHLTSAYDLTAVNPISQASQQAYAAIASNPANAGNAALQQLVKYVPTSSFQVRGVQYFAGVNGQSRHVMNTDWKEWQPRIGFAYRLGPNTVVRGGAGRFTMATQENGAQNGFSVSTSIVPSVDNNLTPYATLANPFPTGIAQPSGSSQGALTNLGNSLPGGFWINPDAQRPYAWEWNLTLQHQFRSWLFEAGYAGNRTRHLWVSQNMNLPSLATWQALNAPQFDGTGKPLDPNYWNTQVPNPFQNLTGLATGSGDYKNSTVALSQLVRPNPLYGDFSENDNPIGKNQWDALLMKAEHRFSKSLMVIGSFSWSRTLEDTTFLGPQMLGHLEHRLADIDRPLRFTFSPVWEIPVGRGKTLGHNMSRVLDAVAGGWELSGQYTLQAGAPIFFTSNTTNGDFFFSGKSAALPRDQRQVGSSGTWFDVSQFWVYPQKSTSSAALANYPAWTGVQSLPGAAYVSTSTNGVYQDFSNWVRNTPTDWSGLRASRVNEVNLGIFKNFHFTERVKLQLRFEAFNTLNHPRWGAPNTTPTSSTFGVVSLSEQNQARAIQLAGKLYF